MVVVVGNRMLSVVLLSAFSLSLPSPIRWKTEEVAFGCDDNGRTAAAAPQLH